MNVTSCIAKSIVLLLFVVAFNCNAQTPKGEILFNDGSVKKEGYAWFNGLNGVRFRKNKRGKSEKYSLNDVKEVSLFNKNNEKVTYTVLRVKNRRRLQGLVLVKEGKVSLYEVRGLDYGGGTGTTVAGGSAPVGQGFRSTYECFLKKADEKEATPIGMFKPTVKKYFKDCPSLVNKIGTKGFRRKNIKDIVEYYNTNCK